MAEGDGAGGGLDFVGVGGRFGDAGGGEGDCAKLLAVIKTPINAGQVERNIAKSILPAFHIRSIGRSSFGCSVRCPQRINAPGDYAQSDGDSGRYNARLGHNVRTLPNSCLFVYIRGCSNIAPETTTLEMNL